jgi:hypothetical protein
MKIIHSGHHEAQYAGPDMSKFYGSESLPYFTQLGLYSIICKIRIKFPYNGRSITFTFKTLSSISP